MLHGLRWRRRGDRLGDRRRGLRGRGSRDPLLGRRRGVFERFERREDRVHAYGLEAGGSGGAEPLSAAAPTLVEIEPRISESAWMFFIR